MKKQILFLTFFVAAILVGNNAFGQYTTYLGGASAVTDIDCANVTTLTCTGNLDELHPQAGQPYTYDVTTSTPASDLVRWFVVNYNDLDPTAPIDSIINSVNDMGHWATGITAGTGYIDAGTGVDPYILTSTNYNAASTTSSVNITWKSFDGINNVILLVVYVEDAANCTDNIEVYRILPVPTFTLDVNAIASNGTQVGAAQTADADTCISPIESAMYKPSADPLTTPGVLEANYGENWVFFTVTAANFTHSWQPTFDIQYNGAYAGTNGEVIEAAWAYPADAISSSGTWTPITIDASAPSGIVYHSGTDDTAEPPTVGADDGSGECIVVRVRIDHGIIPENAINNNTIQMAVNGFMYDMTNDNYTNALNEDIHWEDYGDSDGVCDDPDGFVNDYVQYILTPRPNIITNTGTAPELFETKQNNTDRTGAGS